MIPTKGCIARLIRAVQAALFSEVGYRNANQAKNTVLQILECWLQVAEG